MADEQIRQDEIEALLKNAQQGGEEPPSAEVATPPPVPEAVAPQDSGTRTDDDIQLLLDNAQQALASAANPSQAANGVQPFELNDFAGSPASSEKATLELLRDVELDLKIELGRTRMELEEVLKLHSGSVVSLDKLAGDPVDIYANGRLIARGEVLVLNDNFCVRVAELIASNEFGT